MLFTGFFSDQDQVQAEVVYPEFADGPRVKVSLQHTEDTGWVLMTLTPNIAARLYAKLYQAMGQIDHDEQGGAEVVSSPSGASHSPRERIPHPAETEDGPDEDPRDPWEARMEARAERTERF